MANSVHSFLWEVLVSKETKLCSFNSSSFKTNKQKKKQAHLKNKRRNNAESVILTALFAILAFLLNNIL